MITHGTTRLKRLPGGEKRRGFALVLVLSVIALLSILITDMHQSSSTALSVAVAQRDALRAEYMAKSGLNLTRLLVANEKQIRTVVSPMIRMLTGRVPPKLPVWIMANDVVGPFCGKVDSEDDFDDLSSSSILDGAEGLGDTHGSCEIIAVAENAKVNLNLPLLQGVNAKRSVAMQLYSMLGGYHSPSPYDEIFQGLDPDGQLTTRMESVSSLIDWWDSDTQRTNFDPGEGKVSDSGSEDDSYSRLDDGYRIKNAPLDSLEELRLVRGFHDDIWSTFIEPVPDDPRERSVTIYGSGWVNVNEAPPAVLLARMCSFLESVSLCTDPVEQAKFIQILNTVRQMIPVPLFASGDDLLNFVEGKGKSRSLYPMLVGFLGEGNELLFTPIVVPSDKRVEIRNAFVPSAEIITIQATGKSGRSTVTLETVVNFHDRWAPPPPNPGKNGPLGVFHYYRVK